MADEKKFPVYLTFDEMRYAKSVFLNAPVERDELQICKNIHDAIHDSMKQATTPDAFKAISDAQRLSDLEEDVKKLRETLTHDNLIGRESPASAEEVLSLLLDWARRD